MVRFKLTTAKVSNQPRGIIWPIQGVAEALHHSMREAGLVSCTASQDPTSGATSGRISQRPCVPARGGSSKHTKDNYNTATTKSVTLNPKASGRRKHLSVRPYLLALC